MAFCEAGIKMELTANCRPEVGSPDDKRNAQVKILRRNLLLGPAIVLLAATLTICSTWTGPVRAAVGPGENPVELRLAAMDAVLRGDTSGALDLFNTAIQEANRQYGPNSTFLADLYYEAGSVALDGSQFGPAEHYLTEAVKANPYSTMAKLKLAELYRVQDRAGDAATQFKQAVQVNPNSAVTKQAYIRWLILNGNTPNEQAAANAEALRLAMIKARTDAYFKNYRSTQKSTDSEKPSSGQGNAGQIFGSKSVNSDHNKGEESKSGRSTESPGEIKAGSAVENIEKSQKNEKNGPSLFPFRNIKSDTKSLDANSKAQKAAEKAAEKAQKELEEKNKAAARAMQEEAARRQKQARAEKEKAERAKAEKSERERAEQAKHSQPKADKKAVKQAEPKVEQPAVVPNPTVIPMQPIYPMPGFMQAQPKPNAKRGLVPPPPPAPIPIFGGMPMMQQPAPSAVQKPKPKEAPKEISKDSKETPKETPKKETPKESPKEAPKKEPAKEQVEDKSGGGDVDPEFLLDWSGTEKKKKGR